MKKHSRTSKLSKRSISIIFIVGAVLVLILSFWYFHIFKGYNFPDWTGFGEYISSTGEYFRAKTLWDWLELLIIPIVLASGALLFNRSEKKIERELADQQDKRDREIATDRMRENALQSYLDHMTDLLLKEKLGEAKETPNVRAVARTRTLTVLRMLDGTRKGLVLRFLYESHLISNKAPIVDLGSCDFSDAQLEGAFLSGICLKDLNLRGANLTNADLKKANLRGTNLSQVKSVATNFSGADLRGAFLGGATLFRADLSDANLTEADLLAALTENVSGTEARIALLKTGVAANLEPADLYQANLQWANLTKCGLGGVNLQSANLTKANLTCAHLGDADLTDADLSEAILEKAYLSGANFTNARVTSEQLSKTDDLDETITPDGTKMLRPK